MVVVLVVLFDWLFKRKLFSNVRSTRTPSPIKSLKIYLIFSTYPHKTRVRRLFYVASVFLVLCLLFYFFLREDLKKIVEVFFMSKVQNGSKLLLIHATHKAGPNHLCEYGNLRTTVRIGDFTDRMATNQNAGFLI